MGNSAVYSYPEATGPLHVDDLGETATEIEEEDVVDAPTPVAVNGLPFPVLSAYHYRIRFVLRGFQSATPGTSGNSIERALQGVKNHVNRGGMVGLTLDTAKTFATACSSTPTQAATSLVTPGNLFTAWSSGGVVAANDEVCVETPSPYWKRDIVQASAYSSGTITVGALRYAHGGYPLVRWRYFWPVLWRHEDDGDASTNIIRNDRTISYTLDMTLRYSPDLAAALVGAGGYKATGPATVLRGTSASINATAGKTLDEIVRPPRTSMPGAWR